MPVTTYLSDWQVEKGRSVPDDKECDELLQELRRLSGEDWIVRVHEWGDRRTFADRMRGRKPDPVRVYQLLADCHGEWQVINCVTTQGGTVFHPGAESREAIMNYMLGYTAGLASPPSQPDPAGSSEGER